MLDDASGDRKPTPDAGNRKILLVEDDVATRRLLDELLTEEGYEVECAASGAEAIALLHASVKPRLIILDIWMPYMDGFEFRAMQRSLPKAKDIPVVVITAGGFRKEEAESLGLNRVLMKPLDEWRVLDAVRRFFPRSARS